MKRIQTQKAAEVPATRRCLASAEHAGNKARPGTALSPGQGGLRWRPGRGTHARTLALHTRAAHSLQTHTHARCTLALHTRAAHARRVLTERAGPGGPGLSPVGARVRSTPALSADRVWTSSSVTQGPGDGAITSQACLPATRPNTATAHQRRSRKRFLHFMEIRANR